MKKKTISAIKRYAWTVRREDSVICKVETVMRSKNRSLSERKNKIGCPRHNVCACAHI